MNSYNVHFTYQNLTTAYHNGKTRNFLIVEANSYDEALNNFIQECKTFSSEKSCKTKYTDFLVTKNGYSDGVDQKSYSITKII